MKFFEKNLDSWKNGFCHFWPSEAFAAFVSLLDEFVRMR
jgi:hypothetical protein